MKKSIEKVVLTKEGKVSKSIINMLLNCSFAKGRIYVGYNSGRGRFTSAHSAEATVTSVLKSGGYKFETGNDAPRGGITGEYVKASKAARKAIIELLPDGYAKELALRTV